MLIQIKRCYLATQICRKFKEIGLMYFPVVRSCRYPRMNDHLLVHRITDILGTYIHTGLLKSIRDMHITYGGANILMLVTGKILCENQQFRLACGYLHWLFVVDSEFLATYVILQPLQVHFYLGWDSFQVELEETETSHNGNASFTFIYQCTN